MSNDLFFWFRDGRCPAHSPEVLLTAVRTFTRSAAVIGAATALTFAGAGAAMAATTHEVEGNLLSVTFTQDHWLDGALCFAVAVPTAGAAGVVSQAQDAATGDIRALFDILKGDTAVTTLTTNESGDGTGVGLISVAVGKNTVYAELDPNVYTLITKCTLEDPEINPAVIVGNPLEAVMGSVSMGSSEEGLGAMSSILQGGDGPLGGLLSSAIGGDTE